MSKPKHGKLVLHSDNQWYFCTGRSLDISSGILLTDFLANCQTLLDTGQLFRGHAKFSRVYNARAQLQLRDNVLRHVSAHGLSSLIAPSSLKSHLHMSPEDKQIWDHAYGEEYDGLAALPTWEVLTDKEFKHLSKGVKALPSMAIATTCDDMVSPLSSAPRAYPSRRDNESCDILERNACNHPIHNEVMQDLPSKAITKVWTFAI